MTETDEILKAILAELQSISARLNEVTGYGVYTLSGLKDEVYDAAKMVRGNKGWDLGDIYVKLNDIHEVLSEK